MKDTNGKTAQLSLIDPLALLELAKVAEFGARKYSRYDYLEGGNPYSTAFDAAMRHMMAVWQGQENDAESGLPHAAHAAWNCLALLSYMQRGIGVDDRPPVCANEKISRSDLGEEDLRGGSLIDIA